MLAIGNSLTYMCVKNCQIRAWFDEVIVKMKWCIFDYMVYIETEISAVL